MDLNNLTNDGYAAFILAIVFSVVSIAGGLVLLKGSGNKTTLSRAIFSIVLPAIAIFCWIDMIFNAVGAVSQGQAFYFSFIIVFIIYAIVIGIYFAVKNSSKKEAAATETAETVQVENTEEKIEVEVEKTEDKKNSKKDA